MKRSGVRRAVATLVVGAVLALLPAGAWGGTFVVRAVKCAKTDANEWGRCWKPAFRHITKGNTIKWKNPASNDVSHTVTAYKGFKKDVTIAPGEATTKRFRRTGVFKYRCRFHSQLADGECRGMCGTIHVTT